MRLTGTPGRLSAQVAGRFRRTQVLVSRDGDRTVIKSQPPGPLQLWLINTVGIARKVRQALLDTPELKAT